MRSKMRFYPHVFRKIYIMFNNAVNNSNKTIDNFLKIYYNMSVKGTLAYLCPKVPKYYQLVMEDENDKLIIHKTS